ncbi:MAG TPA: DUF480 domain-containing protein, partial [Solirubrobacterales bacterium]
TNRDPVVDYDEATVVEALRRLAQRGWTRLTSGAGSRARKYRHLLPEALGVADDELALLTVLMLRGPQTPGELKQRSERLHPFADLAAVQQTLERLIEREFVVRQPRRPGQKEERYEQVLGGVEGAVPEELPAAVESPAVESAPTVAEAGGAPALGAEPADDRLDRLEREIAALRAELASLREALGEDAAGG